LYKLKLPYALDNFFTILFSTYYLFITKWIWFRRDLRYRILCQLYQI